MVWDFWLNGVSSGMITFLVVVAIWELIWKGIALWKCGRNNQLTWFVFILVLNTAGILPILYIAFFQKKSRLERAREFIRKKKR